MRFVIKSSLLPVAERFFRNHPEVGYSIFPCSDAVVVKIDPSDLDDTALRRVRTHFQYLDFFIWEGNDLEDVVFWEHPELFEPLAMDFQKLTSDIDFSILAAVESRGFLLGGILSKSTCMRILPIRKHQPFFDSFPGKSADFVNWRGDRERLFIFEKQWIRGKRVLIVDDIIETGNSLETSIHLLKQLGAIPAGAFYLCDVMKPERRGTFTLPIRALLTLNPEPETI